MTDKKIRDCELFATLSNDELERIASSASEKQYEAGTTIFHEGENADELFMLQEGKVALQMTLKDNHGVTHRRMSVYVVSANEVFGLPAAIAPYTHTVTAVCLQNAKVLAINGNDLRWLLQNNPSTGFNVLEGIIKIVVSRLEETRCLLISERLLVA